MEIRDGSPFPRQVGCVCHSASFLHQQPQAYRFFAFRLPPEFFIPSLTAFLAAADILRRPSLFLRSTTAPFFRNKRDRQFVLVERVAEMGEESGQSLNFIG